MSAIDLGAIVQQVQIMAGIERTPGMTGPRLATASPWLRGRVALAQRPDGSWRRCKHARAGEAGWLLLWVSPLQVVCHRCCHALSAAVRGTAEDHRCDVCGKLTDRGVTPFATAGPAGIVIAGGACQACKPIASVGWGEGE